MCNKEVTKSSPVFHIYGKKSNQVSTSISYLWQVATCIFIHMAKKLPAFYTYYGKEVACVSHVWQVLLHDIYTHCFCHKRDMLLPPNSPPIFKWPESEHGHCHRIFSQPAPKMTRFKRSVGWRRAKQLSLTSLPSFLNWFFIIVF